MPESVSRLTGTVIVFYCLILSSCSSIVEPVAYTPRDYGRFSAESFFYPEEDSDIKVVVHRGDWRNVPENSLPAIENSIQMAADMVEIDIRKTRDGFFVLMHDTKVNRTTNGSGLVEEMDLEELKTLRLINAQGELTNHSIPTLEEALDLANGRIMVNLDKVFYFFNDIFPLIQERGMEDQILIKSSLDPLEVSAILGDKKDDVLFMPVVNINKKGAMEKLIAYRDLFSPPGYELTYSKENPEVLRYFQTIDQWGARVWVNTLWSSLCGGRHDARASRDPDATYGWLVDQGVHIIQTDRPEELLAYLEEKGYRE